MAITVTTRSEVTVVEYVTLGPGYTNKTTDVGANTTQLKLGATSTPPVSAKSHFAKALSSGTGTIDLTALVDVQGVTITSTGLRVQAIKVQNPNAHQLAVAPAVSNGYGLTFIVPPQGEVLITSTDLMDEIGSGARYLTLTGTAVESSNWMIVLG